MVIGLKPRWATKCSSIVEICQPSSRGSRSSSPDSSDSSSSRHSDKLYNSISRSKLISIDLSLCKHDIVKKCALALGWKPSCGGEDYQIFWSDLSISSERMTRLNYQRKIVNHFPSMDAIARKIPLALNVGRIKKMFPDDFTFLPKSYVDYKEFTTDLAREVSKGIEINTRFYIVKPNNGCMGRGIFITACPTPKMFENTVVQEYITNPMLIEGRKFDLRVYVLVLSVCPLRILFYQNGLVRMCTEQYQPPHEENLQCQYQHITNYAVNKYNDNFVFNTNAKLTEQGSKRDFTFLNRWLTKNGFDVELVWSGVHDMVVKTVISAYRLLSQTYRSCILRDDDNGMSCFEILGFDIMLDTTGKCWLIEVNHSPSWAVDTPLDHHIKSGVITETMKLIQLPGEKHPPPPRRSGGHSDRGERMRRAAHNKRTFWEYRTRFEDQTMCGFIRLYPKNDGSHKKYDRFLNPMVVVPYEPPPPPIPYPLRPSRRRLSEIKTESTLESKTGNMIKTGA